MTDIIEFLGTAAFIGVAGSAFIDAWSLVLRTRFHVATLDYAMLGRWIGHFRHGRFFHERISAAPPVRGERPLGWVAHYCIGIAFALVLLAVWGQEWAKSPTILPPLLVGIGSVVAPWFIMQPAFGAGIAGARTANPLAGRLRNLGTHTVYGVGLYVSALAISFV
jgi:hypothetical protein